MRRLILQHWAGDVTPLVALSSANVRHYAMRVGADYELLGGYIFDKRLRAQCQKLHMLSEEFDEWDVVVMLDADAFTVKGNTRDIFDETGIGRRHAKAHRKVCRNLPGLTSPANPYWGGSIYRLDLAMRQRLRVQYIWLEAVQFNFKRCGDDEGIMHRLAMRADVPVEGAYLDNTIWCHGHFLPGAEAAAILHIRDTTTDRPGYPANGRDKLANYHHLKEQGILE